MAVRMNAMPVTLVAHVLAIIAAIMVLVWTFCFRGGFSWESTKNQHPVLMLGLIIFGGEAIISYKSFPLEKPVKKLIHLVLHTIALALGIWGFYANFKIYNTNLYSLHSWIGIGVIPLYCFQWLYSFGLFFYPGVSSKLRSGLLPWHAILGLFVYILTVGNAALGFLERLTILENGGLDKYGTQAFLVNFMAIVTVLFGALVVLIASAKSTSSPSVDDDSNYSYSAI